MTTLDIARELHLNPVRVSSHNGGEYASECPMCGGNDRFRVWPEKGEHGAFWCRGCGKGGDAISLLIEAKRMSFKEAAAAVGKRLEARKAPRTPQEPKRQADWVPREISAPAELWQARAAAFVDFCHKELLQNTQQLAWLEGRGITAETARRFCLGWNPKALFRKRPSWGLEVKKEVVDGVEKLKEWFCLPQGLVIPWFVGGQIHRLRVRKPEGEPRYFVVPGSGMAPMMISAAEISSCRRGKAWVVVESELDAVLIAQEAGDIVGAAALGSVATKPDGALYEALKCAGSILVALDFDEAGKKGWHWWQEHFPQADRWVVPRGKDPGEYLMTGGDIRAWVVAGLPPGLRPVAKMAKSVPEPEGKAAPSGDHIAGSGNMVSVAPGDRFAGAGNMIPGVTATEPVPSDDATLTPYIVDEMPCEACGEKLTICWPKRGRRPPAKCFGCLVSARDQREAVRKGRRNGRA